MPDVSAHRQLSPHEEEALEAGKKRWLPRIFQSYGTPIPELMASPLKTGLIFGLPAGVLGAGLGSAIGGAATGKNFSGTGALIGGLGAGGLAALAASMDREAKNEGLEELMRRMPEGAAKRDLLADPQYQSDFLGWDNNKIVATARARYYRPTERFSKRTADMADARSRYNERHKTSSVNEEIIMSQSEKQAQPAPLIDWKSPAGKAFIRQLHNLAGSSALGAVIGGAGGAITSKNKLKGFGRGALMGAGTGLGVAGGATAGMGTGMGVGNMLAGRPGKAYGGLLGLGGGATLGGIAGHSGGSALADSLIGKSEDEEETETKKAAHALLNNNTLTLAEKMAAYKNLLSKQAFPERVSPVGSVPQPVTTVPPIPFDPPAAAAAPAPAPANLPVNLPAPGLVTSGGSAPAGSAPVSRPAAAGSNQPSTLEVLKQLVGVGNRRSTLYDEAAKRVGQVDAGRKALGGAIGENVLYPAAKGISGAASTVASGVGAAASGLNKARLGVGKALGENVLYPAAKGLYNAPAALSALGKYLKPDAPPPPGLLEQLKPYAPYAAVGGAGLGALALADYLSRGKKKKRRPEPRQDEEYDMPKAAHVNWYKLAREHQKRANWGIAKAIGTGLAQYGGAGGILGLLTGDAENGRLRAAGRGVLKGVGTGGGVMGGAAAGARLGAMTGNPLVAGGAGLAGGLVGGLGGYKGTSYMLGPYQRQSGAQQMLQQIMQSKYTPYAAAGLGAAGILGGAAYMGNRAGKQDAKKKKKPEAENKQANLALGAGAGAGLGGLAGGLYGALAPGYEQDPDSGRRRRRSRLMGALRGLAGGAAAGGLAGGAAGHFAGPQIEKILGDFLAKKQDAAQAGPGGMRTDATMQADPVESAKADAMQPAAPIPQGPTNANATMGAAGGMGAMPGLTNEMPGAPPSNALPKQAPVIPQGPAGMSATMGGMPPQQFGM